MRTLKQSTAYDLSVFMTDSADHVTGKTGLTLTITAGKAGAAFASISPTVTERGSGWYSAALTTSHTDTNGDMAFHITGTGADPSDLVVQIRANVLGDTLPASIQSVAAGAITAAAFAANALDAVWSAATRLLTAGTNIVLAKGTGLTGLNDIAAGAAMTLTSGERTAIANEVEAQIIDETDSEKVLTAMTDKIASVNPSLSGLTLAAIASQVRTELTTELARIDASISSRSTYAGADTAGTTTLLARLTSGRAGNLDNLDAAISSLATSAALAAVDAVVDSILADTAALDERVPASPAAVGDVPTAIQVADAWLDRADAIETDLTPRGALRIAAAGAGGDLAGAEPESATITIKNVGNTKVRITAPCDEHGNRTGVTVDAA